MADLAAPVDEAVLPLATNLSAAYDWRARLRTVPTRGSRWSRYAVPVVDVALGAVFLIFALESATFILRFGAYAVYVADFALCLALALVQFGRLRFLRVSFIATYALLAAYAILVVLSPVNLGLNPIIATAVTGLYTVTRWEPDRRWGTAALLLALAGALVNPVTLASYSRAHGFSADPTAGSGWDGTILLIRTLTSLVFVGAVVLTYLLASSRRRIAENQARDVGIAAAQAVAAERLSLARELHDLVGHSLTTIKVQAATGLALGGEERLRSTLTTVRDTADDSLTSVRRLVSVLRSDAGDITPLADLRTIPVLIETTRGSGARINAVLPGPGVLERCNEGWSAIQRLTLVRLVGEALTNAVRHGSGQIELSLMLTPSSCHLHVSNPVSETVEHSLFGGSGLVGLEERLRLVGGTMSHGVQHDGEGSSFFILDVDFPVVPLELPASATDPDQNSGEMTGETGLGDSR
ncbi:two-component sensor histidine kinase [Actinomyces naeslundii]|uniref:histidine kinase n=1 Tax=Actinomyces naeslundii TaxID=1655 RepID=A0ABX3EZN7_ACTNA|nr:histidine kinase [Actinomyces naeslundii]OLO82987.1 two-component sensor histidine kinase [Actinomyces naeslundii]OLO86562.1 two-component sensor histidine kinase [Actinomyces naeslundii]